MRHIFQNTGAGECQYSTRAGQVTRPATAHEDYHSGNNKSRWRCADYKSSCVLTVRVVKLHIQAYTGKFRKLEFFCKSQN